MIDLQLIDKGETYKKLNHSFIIFICMEDVFGKERRKIIIKMVNQGMSNEQIIMLCDTSEEEIQKYREDRT